jgi:hypothetical protein
VQSGKHETIDDKAKAAPAKEAPPLEVVKTDAVVDVGSKSEPEEYQDEDPEVQARIQSDEKYRKAINKKHAEAKSFKALAEKRAEEAAEAEEFAKSQYNRARLAEERAAELESRIKSEPPEPEVKKPVHDEKNADGSMKWYDEKGQFKAFEYAEALAGFAATEAVAKDRKKQVEEAQKAAAAAAEEVAKSHVAESRKLHADYDDVMSRADVKTHPQVLQYMTASDHIGEIAYYLAKNPEYVERINKMNPLKAIAEIGKLEQTFEKPKGEVVTPPPTPTRVAPTPITPLASTGAGAVQTDPSKMDFKQLREYERQRAKPH